MKILLLALTIIVASCSTPYPNKDVQGKLFPVVQGKSLENKTWSFPSDLPEMSILLIGYVQDAQFDIDRWLIGLDQYNVKTPTYELPTIKGLFPRMFKSKINQGMRRGIPKEFWKGVITIYKDGDQVQKFTGNENPNNARVLLVNSNGRILFFHDKGFAVPYVKEMLDIIQKSTQ